MGMASKEIIISNKTSEEVHLEKEAGVIKCSHISENLNSVKEVPPKALENYLEIITSTSNKEVWRKMERKIGKRRK